MSEKSLNKSQRANQNPKSKTQNRAVSAARNAAFEILEKIEKEKAFSSSLLAVYEEKLSPKDRALCHELTLGILRKQIYLDKISEKLTGKKNENFDAAVRIALRIGLYQILFLNKVPVFAAINESVNLVHKAKKRSATGLVNAVLRRAAREEIKLEFSDETEKISVENSFPRWLIEKWIEQFGFEVTKKLAASSNQMPGSAFRLTKKSDENTLGILQKINLEITESADFTGIYKTSGANDILRLYADEGKVYFQDEASQMVARAVNLREGESFLDVCAAPGSKFTLVGSKFKVQSSKLLIGGDLHFHRLRFLKESAKKQGLGQVNLVAYDAEKSLPFAGASFDVCLLDAPCSGTGTIRHNPEIRYFLRKEDFAELAEKQLKILMNASKLIKSGGRLIYSTCSLEKEENEDVAAKFLAENNHFKKVSPELPVKFLTAENFARTFPQRDETDGFFVAAFEKK